MAETGEVLEKIDSSLVKKAVRLDEKVCEAANDLGCSFVVLGKRLAEMKSTGLWKYLLDLEGNPLFRRYEQYTESRVGKMARSRVFELISVAQLGEGSKPISQETIEELGVKKAAELAKLPEAKRTQAVVKDAVKAESVAEVKEQVRGILNEDLPPSEKKEATALLARQLPLKTIDRFEKLEERAIWMVGIRDGDKTLTLKQKFFHALIVLFEEAHEEQLKEGDAYRKEFERLEKERAKEEEAAHEAEKAAKAKERAEKVAARKAERVQKKAVAKKPKAKRGKTPRRRLVQVDAA